MKNIELREYKRLRAAGWHARQALAQAKTVEAFKSLEHEGCVRLRIEPDDCCSMDDLKGDIFSRKHNPEIPEARMAREEKAFEDKVYDEGVWGIVGEYYDADSDEWVSVDSVWGFVGDSWRDSGYDADVMSETIEAYTRACEEAQAVLYGMG